MCYSATIPQPDLKRAAHTDPRTEDAVLIRDAQRGCTSAFETLIRRYDQAILRLALRLTGSEHDAQDIYQEAFLKAYRNIGKFRSESSFYTWMHRIVTNLCMDRLRSKHFVRETSAVTISPEGRALDLFEHIADPHSSSDPERQVFRKELARHIRIALKRLTARERLVFQLRHYDALKLRVIGDMLNTSEETAKNTLFRATHKLRKYLAHVEGPCNKLKLMARDRLPDPGRSTRFGRTASTTAPKGEKERPPIQYPETIARSMSTGMQLDQLS